MIFDDYADVPGGHVRPEDRGALEGVIGVPIWWRGAIVGSCVVFTRDPSRSFLPADAELLELFAKHAAIAITNARLHEAAEANARAEAAAAERNRMAREVHDGVAQGLVSVLLQLRAATRDRGRHVLIDAPAPSPGTDGRRGRVRGDPAQRARPRRPPRWRDVRSRRRCSSRWHGRTGPA